MTDKDALESLLQEFNILYCIAKEVSKMPVEHWLGVVEKGRDINVDPALYLRYVYSQKTDVVKRILHAAVELKRTVLDIQSKEEEMVC